tara:strand:- start:1159 stop:2181 length:1023 start_codon:yes stop_codon:yes gene_type:complete
MTQADPDITDISLDETHFGQRLDVAILSQLEHESLSRMRLQSLIKDGQVIDSATGKSVKQPSLKVKEEMHLSITLPELQQASPEAENIPLDIVYEDEHLLVLNKPAGLVVHPGAGNHSGTLVNALLHHCKGELSGIGGVERPGIVHRLDKETSGLMMVAKNDMAHRKLSKQLQNRTATRIYQALVWDMPIPPSGRIELNIGRHPKDRQKMNAVPEFIEGGREAITDYTLKQRYLGGAVCLIECSLKTGRTHQIRVHMAAKNNELLGDPLYGRAVTSARAALKQTEIPKDDMEQLLAFPRQALHAGVLSFIHPESEQSMTFEAPIPQDIQALITLLENYKK